MENLDTDEEKIIMYLILIYNRSELGAGTELYTNEDTAVTRAKEIINDLATDPSLITDYSDRCDYMYQASPSLYGDEYVTVEEINIKE